MLIPEQKKMFLAIAMNCLRRHGETRPFFSKDVPTTQELDILKKGLKTGEIAETFLERFFPKAYCGVAGQCSENPVFDYYFKEHNKIQNLAHFEQLHKEELLDWCTLWPATVIGRAADEHGGKFLIRTHNGKIREATTVIYPSIENVKESELHPGSHVLVHRDAICVTLSDEDYRKAVKMFT